MRKSARAHSGKSPSLAAAPKRTAKGKANSPAAKRTAGRPPKEIDWAAVAEMFRIQCTIEEVAGVLGITYDTLAAACLRSLSLPISELKKQKAAGGKSSLRRAQFQVAERQQNPTMLIWLGKNYLEQADKLEASVGNPMDVARAIKQALDEIESSTAAPPGSSEK